MSRFTAVAFIYSWQATDIALSAKAIPGLKLLHHKNSTQISSMQQGTDISEFGKMVNVLFTVQAWLWHWNRCTPTSYSGVFYNSSF